MIARPGPDRVVRRGAGAFVRPVSMQAQHVEIARLRPAPHNPRTIDKARFEQLKRSLLADPEMLEARPVIALPNGEIIAGNMRWRAAEALGWSTIPTIYADLDERRAREWLVRDNNGFGAWQEDDLAELLYGLRESGSDVDLLGFESAELDRLLASVSGDDDPADLVVADEARPSLADRFLVPPFSVLDARQGYWQERKRKWLALGIKGEEGRGEDGESGRTFGQDLMRGEHVVGRRTDARTFKDHAWPATHGKGHPQAGQTFEAPGVRRDNLTWVKGDRDPATLDETSRKNLAAVPQSGTSIVDPVLCELLYRWFCPPGGLVVNPTAGESVYGLVAAHLGYPYIGVELRPEQVEANRSQAERLGLTRAVWREGDGRDTARLVPEDADFIICCPPYADLEVYSDDPRDLSTMEYADFRRVYGEIIAATAGRLLPDRFAAFIVGEVRAPSGRYRGFVPDTIAACEAAGLSYYNEAILVTAVGSLPIRVGRQFETSRKVGKTHQNVLVFVKGDARRATAACGPVDVEWPANGQEDEIAC